MAPWLSQIKAAIRYPDSHVYGGQVGLAAASDTRGRANLRRRRRRLHTLFLEIQHRLGTQDAENAQILAGVRQLCGS